MYNLFIFKDNSNPYIVKTNKELFKMYCKYYCEPLEKDNFIVLGLREWNGNKQTYEGRKEVLRSEAVKWQENFSKNNYSYHQLSEWQNFFEEYGKKYGLLKEFKENGIC